MISYLSPLILWRFRRGLAPGVLSRCGRCISLAKALSIDSVSKRAVLVESRSPSPLRIRRAEVVSTELRASKRPRPPCSGEDACALPTEGDFSSLIAGYLSRQSAPRAKISLSSCSSCAGRCNQQAACHEQNVVMLIFADNLYFNRFIMCIR